MSHLISAYLPAPEPEGPGGVDSNVAKLAITVMYLTTFLCLLGMGYTGQHALTLTVGAALGGVTATDWLGRVLNPRRSPRD